MFHTLLQCRRIRSDLGRTQKNYKQQAAKHFSQSNEKLSPMQAIFVILKNLQNSLLLSKLTHNISRNKSVWGGYTSS